MVKKYSVETLCISDSRYWIPDPLSVEYRFRIPIVRGILDSKAHDSRFRNPDYFSWGDTIKRTENGEYLDRIYRDKRLFPKKI